MLDEGKILVKFESTYMICNPKNNLLRYLEGVNFHRGCETEIYVESLVYLFSKTKARKAKITILQQITCKSTFL